MGIVGNCGVNMSLDFIYMNEENKDEGLVGDYNSY